MKITVEIDDHDFERLYVKQMQWHGFGWHDQPGRFDVYEGEDVQDVAWGHAYAYWFDDPVALFIARAFLRQVEGESNPVQLLTDDDGAAPAWLITTNYGDQFREV